MQSIRYSKSFKKISNQQRQILKQSRKGKEADRCSMAPIGNKDILVAVPFSMPLTEAGDRVNKLARMWKDYTLIPVAMPRGVA